MTSIVFVSERVHSQRMAFRFDADFLGIEVADAVFQLKFFRSIIVDDVFLPGAYSKRARGTAKANLGQNRKNRIQETI